MLSVGTANTHDSVGILPVLDDVASLGFQGQIIGDLAYRGARLQAEARDFGLHDVVAQAGGHGGTFVPQSIS